MCQILNKVENYVNELLDHSASRNLLFHSLGHTKEVVNAVNEICKHSNVTENELNVLIVAAWFHDCGYVKYYIGHEEESSRIAEFFLTGLNCDREFIKQVIKCINATKYSHIPSTLAEKIIRDADMYHLCKPNYHIYEELLRRELELHQGFSLSDKEWQVQNYEFLKNHQYHTEYGQKVLNHSKEINMQIVKENI
ncbi:hypothetical protein AXA65_11895 [Chryseobacterium sp. FP211-J200]|nr:hypothetical protein AXA65_11895 [Chryseobacterium sp. FP211-J200]HBV17538.1 HD domain-containing protein [Chryseobacterium carnipullorum]